MRVRVVRSDMDVKNLATLYDLPTIEWSRIDNRLAEGLTQAPETGGPNRHTSWLATVNPDASPHVTAVGALWVDGAFWFQTGPDTRKARNLAANPRCSIHRRARFRRDGERRSHARQRPRDGGHDGRPLG